MTSELQYQTTNSNYYSNLQETGKHLLQQNQHLTTRYFDEKNHGQSQKH
ncbi:hypothetical protein BVRB_7g157210 [Beta vulgaris subsp. vulgaris]|nr:hypothetical protein BVRB_7g157210 [Beta vulgaris subsp. vulgaris]